jgi:putative nucleotide binding protein
MNKELQREEEAIVLDFLPNGYSSDNRPSHLKTAVAQAVGMYNLNLLELVPKKDVFLQPFDEVYVGDDKREKIHHVAGKIPFTKLTGTARAELEPALRTIIKEREGNFVDFFNKSQPLSTRMHSLELLPGLGKKLMWEIIEERRGDPFKSLADLKQRIKTIDPEKLIIKRILKELKGEEKYNIFVK